MNKLAFLLFILVTTTGNSQYNLPKNAESVSPLLIGEKIPSVVLLTDNGNKIAIDKIVNEKKTILLFYRGGWCPYCNQHLSAVAEIEDQLMELGYQIVAISPDAPSKLAESIEKNNLKYRLLSDSENNLSKAIGIAFEAPKNYEKYLVKGSEGKNSSIIPVPSVFIISTNGTILFEYIAPDYKHRISSELLVSVAKVLSHEK